MVHHGYNRLFSSSEIARQNAAELLTWKQTDMQTLIDQFCAWLAAEAKEADIYGGNKLTFEYTGFPSLAVSSWWSNVNGHELEAMLRRVINPITEQQRQRALFRTDRNELISFQTRTLPELLSKDLVAIFTRLQKVASA